MLRAFTTLRGPTLLGVGLLAAALQPLLRARPPGRSYRTQHLGRNHVMIDALTSATSEGR